MQCGLSAESERQSQHRPLLLWWQVIAWSNHPAGLFEVAVGETVILLHPPPTYADVPTVMERGCQQNDSLADGYMCLEDYGAVDSHEDNEAKGVDLLSIACGTR